MTKSLNSERIFLSKYRESDRNDFSALLSDQDVMCHVGGLKSSAEIEKLFERAMGRLSFADDLIWAIKKNSDQAYLGHAALYRSDVCSVDEREILFYLHKDFWGCGYGAEVGKLILRSFVPAKSVIRKVKATIDIDHLASIKVCEKIGMRLAQKGLDEEGEFLIYEFACEQAIEN